MTARAQELYRAARAAMARRDARAAQDAIARLLHEYPGYAFGWLAASIFALERLRPDQAVQAARRGLQIACFEPALLVQHIRALTAAGSIAEARAAVLAAEPHLRGAPAMLHELGNAAAALDLHDDALRLMRAAHAVLGDDPALCYNMAAVLRYLGRFGESKDTLDTVIRLTPRDCAAHLMRAQIRRQTSARNHVEVLTSLLDDAAIGWNGKVQLHYALGKELEDLGEAEPGFLQIQQGAALRRQHLQYDVGDDVAAMASIAARFDRVAENGAAGSGPRPIFVFGLPRSGTTLVERILGCHGLVTSLGEINDFPISVIGAASPAGRRLPKSGLIEAAARVPPERFGQAYRTRIKARAPDAVFVTDKLPMNYLYAGVVANALPESRLVLVLRDPMANGYGLYKTLFQQGYPFSYDLDEIGRYMAGYLRLVEHWRCLLGSRLFVLKYEDLVANPGQVTRDLLAFCGLEWDPACLSPEANPAPVTSQSAVQVREALHVRNVESWRLVERHLLPLARHVAAAA